MLRPRVLFAADQRRRLITIRYIGNIAGDIVVSTILDHLNVLERVWEYDSVFDLTRHEGLVEMRDHDAFARGWRNLAGGRDAGRRTAVVSLDPLIEARLPLLQSLFPFRTLMVFNSMSAAEAWLQEGRENSADTISAA